MLIRIGYESSFQVPQPTPMILMLNTRPERAADLLAPDYINSNPAVPVIQYYDLFGNLCSRVVVPAGETTFHTSTLIRDPGVLDDYEPDAAQHHVEDLPPETLVYLLGSRYCETEKLLDFAW